MIGRETRGNAFRGFCFSFFLLASLASASRLYFSSRDMELGSSRGRSFWRTFSAFGITHNATSHATRCLWIGGSISRRERTQRQEIRSIKGNQTAPITRKGARVESLKRPGADCFPAFVAFSSFRLRSRLLRRLPSCRCAPLGFELRVLRETEDIPDCFPFEYSQATG